METIYLLLVLIVLGVIINEFSICSVYGGFISKEVEDVFMNLDENTLRLSSINSAILSTTHFTSWYISTIGASLFSKYHISGLGTVPRWSKLHKRIDQYYVIAIKNGMK